MSIMIMSSMSLLASLMRTLLHFPQRKFCTLENANKLNCTRHRTDVYSTYQYIQSMNRNRQIDSHAWQGGDMTSIYLKVAYVMFYKRLKIGDFGFPDCFYEDVSRKYKTQSMTNPIVILLMLITMMLMIKVATTIPTSDINIDIS